MYRINYPNDKCVKRFFLEGERDGEDVNNDNFRQKTDDANEGLVIMAFVGGRWGLGFQSADPR